MAIAFRIAVITAALALHCWSATSALAADAGWVARINGAPTVTRESQTQALKQGDTVRVGDRINTDQTAKVKILLIDDSVLAIGPRSQVVLDELSLSGDSRTGRLNVLLGRFKIAIAAWLGGRSDYEVRTPTAVAGVRGTVLWGDTQLDAICALQGDVQIRSLQGAPLADLHTGKCVAEMGRGTAVPLVPSAEDLAKYLKEVTLD
jgi:hypothetical protein